MNFKVAGCSETGPVRDHNEDAILMETSPDAGLFLVADGMGGRTDGEFVSRKLREDYGLWWTQFQLSSAKPDFQGALDQLKNTLLRLNREVVQRYGEKKAGSTLVLLFLYQGNCACLWAGDSRIYRFRTLSMEQITKDDVFRTTEAGKESMNGKLTGAVGLRTTLEFNMRTDAIRSEDGFFLCSDGVYRFAKPPFLKKKLSGMTSGLSSPAQIVESIRREVLKNGARDNYSMIYVKVRL